MSKLWPATFDELEAAGYQYVGHGLCSSCCPTPIPKPGEAALGVVE